MRKKLGIFVSGTMLTVMLTAQVSMAASMPGNYNTIVNTAGNVVSSTVSQILNSATSVRIGGGSTSTGNSTNITASSPGAITNNSTTTNTSSTSSTTTVTTSNGPGSTATAGTTGSVGRSSLLSGPEVQEASVSEKYYSDYGIYEEGIGGAVFFYSNASNGGITDQPVYVDIPSGVSYTMEKDGVEIDYTSKQVVSAHGSYVLRLTVVADRSVPVRQQQAYKATFRFRIMDKTAEARAAAAAAAASQRASIVQSSSELLQQATSQNNGSVSLPASGVTSAYDAISSAVGGVLGGGSTETILDETAEAEPYIVSMTLPNGRTEEYVYQSYAMYQEAVSRGDLTYGLITEEMVEEELTETETEASAETESTAETETTETEFQEIDRSSAMGFGEAYDAELSYYVNTLLNGDIFYTNVPEGMVTNREVNLIAGSGVEFRVKRNGEEYSYESGSMISESGDYAVEIIVDSTSYERSYYGKETPTFHFRIVENRVNDLGFITAPYLSTINNAWRGQEALTESIQDGRYFAVTEDGQYSVEFLTPAGTQTVNFIYDNLPPRFKLSPTNNNNMQIVYETDDAAYAMIYKNDELWVDHRLVSELDGPGRYRIEVYDEAGNVGRLSYEITYRMNRSGIIVIAALVLIIAGLAVFVIRIRRNSAVQ